MQVPPVPNVIVPGAQPQDALALVRVLPNIQSQAAAPLLQRAVDPSPRSDRGPKTRSNKDRAKGGGKDGGGGQGRGGSVNIRV